jgi:dihydroorotase
MKRGSLLIKGGRLVDPSLALDALRDVRITGGIVYEIGEDLDAHDGELVFDASNAVVAPGFVDMHVHLREPGFSEKETVATGTEAAVRGGFTAVACMPNTQPALDDPRALDELLQNVSRNARCAVYPVGAITRGRLGVEPCDFAALSRAGAVAFSDDGNSVSNPRVLRDAALTALDVEGVFISHCEDEALKGAGVMNEGTVSRALGLVGSSAVAEDAVVARDLLIAGDTGKAWHIAHLSTATALGLVAYARARGVRTSCEVTPHHLTFTDEAVRELGGGAKVNPPLRTGDDVRALREGVRDGTIDVFASDHAPHLLEEKSGAISEAAVGFSGLEVAVGAYAAAVPGLPLLRFVALLSTNPAQILGLKGGTLAVGSPGDVTVFAERAWIVDPTRFVSKGRTTPFAGQTLPRRAIATVVAGTVAYSEP